MGLKFAYSFYNILHFTSIRQASESISVARKTGNNGKFHCANFVPQQYNSLLHNTTQIACHSAWSKLKERVLIEQ